MLDSMDAQRAAAGCAGASGTGAGAAAGGRQPHASRRLARCLPAIYLECSHAYWAPGGPRLPWQVGWQRSAAQAGRDTEAASCHHSDHTAEQGVKWHAGQPKL